MRTQIRSALRQAWRMHPDLQAVLKRDRIERPYTKKDGSTSSKPRIFFACYVCKCECPRKDVNIDHKEPVGPTPGSKLAPPELTWDTFIERMFFSGTENLAPICHTCHSAKTQREGAERRKAMGMTDANQPEDATGRDGAGAAWGTIINPNVA